MAKFLNVQLFPLLPAKSLNFTEMCSVSENQRLYKGRVQKVRYFHHYSMHSGKEPVVFSYAEQR